MNTEPYWRESGALPEFGPLTQDVQADVAVIGGGLTGITAAYLMKQAGARVVLLERARCAAADTGHTTAHLTYVTDERLHRLVDTFGRDAAQAFWQAGVAAIDQIDQLVRDNEIGCEFRWVPGYLHEKLFEPDKKARALLEKDAELAREFGFQAEFMEDVPYAHRAGVRFAHQAKFHPIQYLRSLLEKIPGDGSHVFEESEATDIDDNQVQVGRHKVKFDYVVIATHTPLVGKTSLASATLFQSKLALYTSYVLGARLPRGAVPEALFWDTSDPYYYLRLDRRADGDYAIFGGEDVKTGQEEDNLRVFGRLETVFKRIMPEGEVRHHWLGQVVETNDGLPFIGESAGRQFIATGFCGNGFTLGTLSAVMARDRYLGRKNPWFDLFRVDRRKFHGGTWRYIRENLDYPYYMLRDRLGSGEKRDIDEVGIGEGAILNLGGKRVAAFRDENGKVTLLSPVCTHLQCIVRWNNADKTWDCPCHGSRFKPTGEVFSGPAESPLEKVPWPEESSRAETYQHAQSK